MRKFYVSKSEIKDNKAYLTGENYSHLVRVLRINPGEKILLLDGEKRSNVATVERITDTFIEARLGEWRDFDTENENVKITLYQAVPKGSKLKTIVEKATELGVSEIIPFYSERSIPKSTSADRKKREQLERVAEAASKQCGRGVIPIISPYTSCEKLVLSGHDLVLVAYENEEKISLKDILEGLNSEGTLDIALLIGPEGGFSEEEIKTLTDLGALSFSLGKRILRTETAGIAAIAQINYALEE